MNLMSNPYVKTELDNIQIQFGDKALLTLDDCSKFFSLNRKYIARALRRKDIPVTKIGKGVYVKTLDLALHFARLKALKDGTILTGQVAQDDANSRRGFSQMAYKKQLEKLS